MDIQGAATGDSGGTMSEYFKKYGAGYASFTQAGFKITPDFIGQDNFGYVKTDDSYLSTQIKKAIANQTGGWSAIDQAAYDEAFTKKNLPPKPKPQRVLSARQPFPVLAAQQPRDVGRVANVANKPLPHTLRPDPIQVPSVEQMRPRSGKLRPKLSPEIEAALAKLK